MGFSYEIIVDHGETANKCTILPLAYREDFRIHQGTYRGGLEADFLLHPDGEMPSDGIILNKINPRIAAIDCIWRRLDPILDGIEKPLPRLIKIPAEFTTAYPRRSKHEFDPECGLATIEAIFVASAFLGNWDQTLLKEYFFGALFVRQNESAFRKYGIEVKNRPLPLFVPTARGYSNQRRLARGRKLNDNHNIRFM